MSSNLNFQEYNYDYSNNKIPFNNNLYKNNSFISKNRLEQKLDTIPNNNDININSLTQRDNNSNKYRISNLEERISSLEKMLHFFDEFIHLKEQEKKDNTNNIQIEPLIIKINYLEKEIKNLHKEKEENKKIISELNEKIINLEKKLDENNKDNNNDLKDIIYSLSDKEKKLNLLINDISDIAKENNNMINNKMNEKISELNIFNENRINELLVLIHDINKIIEENENKVNRVYENLDKIQKDNLNIVKYISVQDQKFNSFELIMNEISNLKEKFYLIMNDNNPINTKIENII